MKKLILTSLISFGMILAANADRKGHRGHDSHDRGHGKSGHVYKGHSGHDSHHSRSHRGHGSHYGHHHSGHRSYSTHYTTTRVWVPGCSKRVWVPPRYEYRRRPCGTLVRICVSAGYYNTVYTDGYYTYKRVPVYNRSSNCGSGVSISWRF